MTIVRHADPHETETAIDVWRAANPDSRLEQHPDRLRRWSSERGAHVHVAVDQDRVIGMVLSVLGRADDGAGEVVPGLRHLIGLAVAPTRRREGVARRLVCAVIDEARREACEWVRLWVHADNAAARRLFESVGFRATGRSALDDGGTETSQMELSLVRDARGRSHSTRAR